MSLSQKFQKESAALEEWLTTSEAQLQQKNSCGDMPADIDAEIAWANVSNCPHLFIKSLQQEQRSASASGQKVEHWDSIMFLKTPISLSLLTGDKLYQHYEKRMTVGLRCKKQTKKTIESTSTL